ncbi:unnamed protein product [Bursaphelenchus xylophilus]|uniref:(pine wood nematode) hypothetical protein n=1 Tax=Bursaphelenchus xylophilus TaxID=6326 RepID=A0A1I7S8H6_BURXY|nr:unnamed protein product [Bursaphelenchus xylophilus]CAG9121099.1 unnamed protein product [Bursaphelenchus xylophilus]
MACDTTSDIFFYILLGSLGYSCLMLLCCTLYMVVYRAYLRHLYRKTAKVEVDKTKMKENKKTRDAAKTSKTTTKTDKKSKTSDKKGDSKSKASKKGDSKSKASKKGKKK